MIRHASELFLEGNNKQREREKKKRERERERKKKRERQRERDRDAAGRKEPKNLQSKMWTRVTEIISPRDLAIFHGLVKQIRIQF